MDFELKNSRVIVTAGARGIGLETARRFLSEGAKVHVCDVDGDALAALKKSEPAITASKADVSDRRDVEKLFSEATAKLGGLDSLINNAGIAGPTGRVDEIAPEDWDRTLAVNITGQFNCARLAVPHLKSSKNASIVNLSSAAGKFGFPLRTPYAASKWAVVGFTKTLSIELGPLGIRVNAILPGPVEGDRIRSVIENKAKAGGISFEEMKARFLAPASIKSMITARQIADQILFLCSPLARTISGQAVSVDGDVQGLA